MGTKFRANIAFTGDEAADLAFAAVLASQLAVHLPVSLIDIDALERDPTWQKLSARGGCYIYVLSPRLVETEARRERLIASSSNDRNLPDSLTFYVCRGQTVRALSHRYPDLQGLLGDVTLGEESDLDALVAKVKQWVRNPSSAWRLSGRLKQFASLVVATSISCTRFFTPIYALILIPVAAGTWWELTTQEVPACGFGLGCLLAFAAGMSITKVESLELHPWLLGARDAQQNIWGELANEWCVFARRVRVVALFKLAFFGFPVLALFSDALPRHQPIGAACLIAGAVWLPLLGWSLRYFQSETSPRSGLRPQELLRRELREGFARRHKKHPVLSSGLVFRRWTRPRDFVFICYAREDDQALGLALPLAETLERLQVPFFLDKFQTRRPFAPWRVTVAQAICRCTHVFVILGPKAHSASVLPQELRAVFQRRDTDLLPSVICVGDDDVLAQVSLTRSLPIYFSSVLNRCPRLSPNEALDDDVVHGTIAQHRNQGIALDWSSLVWPRAALRRWLRSSESSLAVSNNYLFSEFANALGLSPHKEWARCCFLAVVMLFGWNLLCPASDIMGGLFWRHSEEHLQFRPAKLQLPTGPQTIAELRPQGPQARLRFEHWPNSVQHAHFCVLELGAKLIGLSPEAVSLTLRFSSLGGGAVEKSFRPFVVYRRRPESGLEDWLRAGVPLHLPMERAGRLEWVSLGFDAPSAPAKVELRSLRLLRNCSADDGS